MKKYIVCLMGLVMALGFVGISSAAIVADPGGDAIGPTDITAIRAEQFVRPGDVSYTATPNIGGLMIFEADVDSSTGTGGVLSMTGIPVTPCPCKSTVGMDVAIIVMNRPQGPASNSALCGTERKSGEWYAIKSTGGSDTTGILRGYTDPVLPETLTSRSYTFPWSHILAYVNIEITPDSEKYDYLNAVNFATTRWQLSVWTDANYAVDQDDFGDGSLLFNISDWAPNGDGVLVTGVDDGSVDRLIFCEGNFDGDPDVDGQDASKFKTDFGRSKLSFPCPSSNYYY
jgi:hypothetical protein